jgi:hypothetical protein
MLLLSQKSKNPPPPGELSAIVSDDRVRDPKMKNDVLDEIYGLLGANLSQGPHLDPLSKFIDRNR